MTADNNQMDQPSHYDEPTKVAARTEALTHAVKLLTERRDAAAAVASDHIERVKAKLIAGQIPGYGEAAAECLQEDIESWKLFRAQSVGRRRAEELTVAYLAGPRPSNDLKALINLGLRAENIWAFETNLEAVGAGVKDLDALGLRGVKFVPVGMSEYFVGTPRRFDIIYVDACGPLPSNDQKTTALLVDIFLHGALAPLGVLITNFSRPGISDQRTTDNYASLIAAYLYPKAFMEGPEGMTDGAEAYGYSLKNPENAKECFTSAVKAAFDHHYGAFITRHVLDIASIVAPLARLIDSRLYRVLFDEDLTHAIERGRRFARFNPAAFGDEDEVSEPELDSENGSEVPDMDGDAITDPSMHALLWTLAACGFYETDCNFDEPADSFKRFAKRWKNQLSGSTKDDRPKPVPIEDVIAAFYAWRGDASLWSSDMKSINEFPYRGAMPFFCDVPTQELGFYPAIAQLSYPTLGTVREIKRLRYVAEGKKTPMFMDVIAFDECRYVYDWLSSPQLMPGNWSDISAQLIFRFGLDAIVKDRRWFGDDFLFGCHVIGIDNDFQASELAPRRDLSPNEPKATTNASSA